MTRFYIVDGLPFLIGCNGSTFAVRLDEGGFTIGKKVRLPEVPAETYSEVSVRAKCRKLDSITIPEPAPAKAPTKRRKKGGDTA